MKKKKEKRKEKETSEGDLCNPKGINQNLHALHIINYFLEN